MNLYDKVGKMALGSRLRRLSESLTEQAAEVYGLYNIDFQPKWFPVFYALAASDKKSITQIAKEIGHSHPSVSIIAKEMIKAGLIKETENNDDARKNYVVITKKGLALNEQIQFQYVDVNAAVEQALTETQHNLWKAIEEWEFLLSQKNLLKRVQDQKKIRESAAVKIVAYEPKYQQDFKAMNESWISTYFKMEATDYKLGVFETFIKSLSV